MFCNTYIFRKQGLIHMTLESADVVALRTQKTETCFLIITRRGTT